MGETERGSEGRTDGVTRATERGRGGTEGGDGRKERGRAKGTEVGYRAAREDGRKEGGAGGEGLWPQGLHMQARAAADVRRSPNQQVA